jgi:hypothetical protein
MGIQKTEGEEKVIFNKIKVLSCNQSPDVDRINQG